MRSSKVEEGRGVTLGFFSQFKNTRLLEMEADLETGFGIIAREIREMNVDKVFECIRVAFCD